VIADIAVIARERKSKNNRRGAEKAGAKKLTASTRMGAGETYRDQR
jgi:hypothetical protein